MKGKEHSPKCLHIRNFGAMEQPNPKSTSHMHRQHTMSHTFTAVFTQSQLGIQTLGNSEPLKVRNAKKLKSMWTHIVHNTNHHIETT